MPDVVYDGLKLIPAPMINIQKNYQTTEDGTKVGAIFNVTVNGRLVAFKGSPRSKIDPLVGPSGFAGPNTQFWNLPLDPPDENIPAKSRLPALIRKQEALRLLFAKEGRVFEILPEDGSPAMQMNPRIVSIEFPGGTPDEVVWFDTSDYVINLEVDVIFLNNSPVGLGEDIFTDDGTLSGIPLFLTSANEDWSLEFGDAPNTFRFTHNLSATAKKHYNNFGQVEQDSWINASLWVKQRLSSNGPDLSLIRFHFNKGSTGNVFPGGSGLPSDFEAFNHVRNEQINKTGGTYSISETWLIASGDQDGNDSLEDFSVNTTFASEGQSTDIVRIEGTVTGLSKDNVFIDANEQKFDNADARFAIIQNQLFGRAKAFSGINFLSAIPKTKVIGKNPFTGVVNYSFEFEGGGLGCKIFANSLSEVITVTEVNQGDVFASIPVLGRVKGPVLQDIGTKTAKGRQLSVDITVPATGDCVISSLSDNLNLKPNTDSIVAELTPVGTQVFKASDSESWTWQTGRYNRNVSWTFE